MTGPGVLDLMAQAGSSGGTTAEAVVFWVFAVIGVGAGIAMVSLRNIVHAALMLVINLVAIAVLYLALQSPFLGVIQVIVYAGAIVVLFLFVIMLLGVDTDDLLVEVSRTHRAGALALVGLVAAAAILAFSGSLSAASRCDGATPSETVASLGCRGLDEALAGADDSSVSLLGERLFDRYTFPFEAAAVLLTVATIGALVLGRREDLDPDDDPAWAPSTSLSAPRDRADGPVEPATGDELPAGASPGSVETTPDEGEG